MDTYQILCLIGIPALISSGGAFIVGKFTNNIKRVEALERGVQALLRDRLYQSYTHYSERGYAPIQARENFENMWRQYHNLGKNGVMDSIHEKFMDLPTEKLEES